MTVTQEEIDRFHDFASKRIREAPAGVFFDDLIIEWESLSNRDAINPAIREGLSDVDTGRHRPAREAMEELRQKHAIDPQRRG